MRKKLPIGIQSFEKIRSDNYYYVDKTHFIKRLIDNGGGHYFLSRPRRFGKSLFLDTLKQAFLAKKELFKGLYLEDKWDWSIKYPVIHIDFGIGTIVETHDLENRIRLMLTRTAISCQLQLPNFANVRDLLEELILQLHQKYNEKVVMLVDEYDKPILDNIVDKDKARQIRDILKNLYSVLKPLDEHLKFVFLTGVSKFSKVSIFSGLNQLKDITLDKNYSGICGYTEEEFINTFTSELARENIERIREWYNGYSFCGVRVYNPFDILLYLSEREYKPFWFETGTPEFLIQLLIEKKVLLPKLENLAVTEELLSNFDIDLIDPENLLFHTGYLTIKEYEQSTAGNIYYLTYPNKEVKISLNKYLIRYLTQFNRVLELGINIRQIFKTASLDKLEDVLKSLFSSIPYEWHTKSTIANYEGYYASVVYSFLASTGVTLIPEDHTNIGRIDLTIVCENKVYIIEFKVVELDTEKSSALEQIEQRRYFEKYTDKYNGEVYLIGIDFSKEKKNIGKFAWKRL